MYALMTLETTLLTERLITDVTAKWPVTAVCALVSLQITLLTE
jgi:hypothetical protein